MTRVTYRPEIDGLRAVAVMAVVFFHVGFGAFGGGYVGVDVFFVISGYLITALIRSDCEQGRFSYADFYIRRARRLFPALFVVLLASFVVAVVVLTPRYLDEFSDSLICTTFFVSNICFWRQSGYFDIEAIYKPLLHMWSLSVEEQFYLVWPTVLVGLLSLGPAVRRSRFAPYADWGVPLFLLVASFISLRYAEKTLDDDAAAVFFLAPYRIAEFAVGAALVWLEAHRPRGALPREALFLTGLALILFAVFVYTDETPFPGLTAMVPCVGAGLVIFAGRTPYLGRLLDNRIAVGIGLVSYSLYLVHWPIIVFWQYVAARPLTAVEQWAVVAASIGIAVAMYFRVEMPFRRRPPRGFAWSGRKIALVSAALATVLVGPATYVSASQGMEWRLSPDVGKLVKQLKQAAVLRQRAIRGRKCHFYSFTQKIEDFVPVFERCNTLGERNIAVIGDSHAAGLWLALSQNVPETNFIQLTGAGCSPWSPLPECAKLHAFARDYIAGNRDRIDGVLVTARMASSLPEDVEKYRRGFTELNDSFAEMGVKVVVFGPHVEYSPDVPTLVASRLTTDGIAAVTAAYAKKDGFEVTRALGKSLEAAGIPFVDTAALFCVDGACPAFGPNGEIYVTDYGHWAIDGANWFARRLIDRYGSVDTLLAR